MAGARRARSLVIPKRKATQMTEILTDEPYRIGVGQEDSSRREPFVIDAGEPALLLANDHGANPAEALLHALAACHTTSIVYVAAAR